jgi:hypothetical protein
MSPRSRDTPREKEKKGKKEEKRKIPGRITHLVQPSESGHSEEAGTVPPWLRSGLLMLTVKVSRFSSNPICSELPRQLSGPKIGPLDINVGQLL